MQNPWSHIVIYQIYPRSFKDSNNDGIGDLQGIIEKLDYLQNLGVSAIWLSPFYPSPMKDFGYDISDYCNIDPLFGDLDDFDEMVRAAHEKNIKIIIDYVPNHTSDLHPWFVESRSEKDNPKRDWYIWKDAKPDGSVPNNWLSNFGGSAWEWDVKTKQYYLHTFLKEQPDLNWHNPQVKKAMFAVLRFWLERGVDGFRVDAFDHVYKDNRFLDEPQAVQNMKDYRSEAYFTLEHIYSRHQPELFTLINEFCTMLAEYNSFMILEVNSVKNKFDGLLQFYKAGENKNSLSLPFNFGFFTLPWTAKAYKTFVDEFDTKLGEKFIPTYVLGNHDVSRVATRIGMTHIRIAAMLLLTLRGIPTIYYGEEIGMQDVPILEAKAKDPYAKLVKGKLIHRDPERTPMQWTAEEYAGFSQTTPWLPIADNYKTVNVASEQNKTSILALYKQLLNKRKKYAALKNGKYASLSITNNQIFAYTREDDGEKLLIILNFSNIEQNISLPIEETTLILSTYLDRNEEKMNLNAYTLRPNEGLMLQIG